MLNLYRRRTLIFPERYNPFLATFPPFVTCFTHCFSCIRYSQALPVFTVPFAHWLSIDSKPPIQHFLVSA